MFNAEARWDRPLPQEEDGEGAPTAVVASFKRGKFFPLWFFVNGTKHVVKNVHFFWQEPKGSDTRYFFSVTNAHDTRFTVCFRHRDLSWRVLEHAE